MVLQDLRSVLSTVQFCPGRLAQHVDVGKHPPPLQLKAFNLPWLEARLKCSASAKPHGHFFAARGRKWQLSIPDTASAWGLKLQEFFFFFFTCFQKQSNRWLSTIWIIRSTLKAGCCSSALLPNMQTFISPLQLTGWWNRGARGLLFVKV